MRVLVLTASWLALVLNVAASDLQIPPDAQALVKQGYTDLARWTDLNREQKDNILHCFDHVASIEPLCAKAHCGRSMYFYRISEYDKAIIAINKAILLEPKAIEYYKMRALINSSQGKTNEAMNDLDYVISISIDDYSVFFLRGRAWADKKEWDKTIQDLNAAIELLKRDNNINPETAEIYSLRARARKEKNNLLSAIDDCKEAIRRNDSFPDPYIILGDIWYEGNEWDKAIAWYTNAHRLNVFDMHVLLCRGNSLFNLKKWDEAKQDADSAIRIDPKDDAAYLLRGRILREKKEFTKALPDADAAIQLQPNSIAALLFRGTLLLELHEWEKSLADLDRLLQIDSHNEYGLYFRSWVRSSCPEDRLRDGIRALNDAKLFYQLSKSSFSAAMGMCIMGLANAELGDFEEAIKCEKKAMEDSLYLSRYRESSNRFLELYLSKTAYRLPRQ
jgi:tetratricopeptide (TPR) repeat protein